MAHQLIRTQRTGIRRRRWAKHIKHKEAEKSKEDLPEVFVVVRVSLEFQAPEMSYSSIFMLIIVALALIARRFVLNYCDFIIWMLILNIGFIWGRSRSRIRVVLVLFEGWNYDYGLILGGVSIHMFWIWDNIEKYGFLGMDIIMMFTKSSWETTVVDLFWWWGIICFMFPRWPCS